MGALIEAARSPGFSAEIVLVLSDDPAAAGLSLARDLGVAAEAIDFRAYAGKPAFEAALAGAARVRRQSKSSASLGSCAC